jgi:hypothetical protein
MTTRQENTVTGFTATIVGTKDGDYLVGALTFDNPVPLGPIAAALDNTVGDTNAIHNAVQAERERIAAFLTNEDHDKHPGFGIPISTSEMHQMARIIRDGDF